MTTADALRQNFQLDVRVRTEAIAINRQEQYVEVQNLETDEVEQLPYDSVVLSPGAQPLVPPLPGLSNEGVFTIRNVPDSQAVRDWIEQKEAKRAVVVGGGFTASKWPKISVTVVST